MVVQCDVRVYDCAVAYLAVFSYYRTGAYVDVFSYFGRRTDYRFVRYSSLMYFGVEMGDDFSEYAPWLFYV